ncbi:MAG: hypothetical protein ACLVEF_01340 [Bifidobacterium bifidum]
MSGGPSRFSHTAAPVLLPVALPVMAEALSGFDCSIRVLNSDAILEQTGMKAVQLGVVEKPIVNDSVDRVTLREDRLVLAGDPHGVWMVRDAHGLALLHGSVLQDGRLRAVSHRSGSPITRPSARRSRAECLRLLPGVGDAVPSGDADTGAGRRAQCGGSMRWCRVPV